MKRAKKTSNGKAKAKAKATKAKAKAKAANTKPKAGGETKNDILNAMLKEGATVEAMTSKLEWLPHTLRARLSRINKQTPIKRSRENGVTSYQLA